MGKPNRPAALATLVLMIGAVTGCSTDSSVEDLDSLREAFVAAGGECADLVENDGFGPWQETGTCDGSVLLFIYADEEQRDLGVESMKSLGEDPRSKSAPESGIAGTNWIITPTDDAEIAKAMDAEIVSF